MTLRKLALAGLTAIGLSGCGAATQVTPPGPAVQQPASPAANQGAQTSAAQSIVQSQSESPAAQPADSGVQSSASQAGAPSPSAAARPAASSSVAAPAEPAVAPTPASIRLGPLQYIRQTLNNCGPASIAEVLRYWGINRTQDQVQAVVRPDFNTRGMWPYGVPGYVSSAGMNSLMGVGGTPTIVKALVANGFPVIVAQWVSADDHTAHYREIEGFDDKRQVFVSTDSYLGPNHEIGYAEFDQIWARGNQRFMVIFPPDKQPLLSAVLKSVGWDKTAAYQTDLARQDNPQLRQQDQPEFQFQGPQSKGMQQLGHAWDHIQLGQLDLAKSEIEQAQQQGANPVMVKMISSALTVS
jgi:predicted double-glycine peptidase